MENIRVVPVGVFQYGIIKSGLEGGCERCGLLEGMASSINLYSVKLISQFIITKPRGKDVIIT